MASKRASSSSAPLAKRSKVPAAEDLVGEARLSPFAASQVDAQRLTDENMDEALAHLYKQDAALQPLIEGMNDSGGWFECGLWSSNGRRLDGSVDSIRQFCCLAETRLRSQITVMEANKVLEQVKATCGGEVTPVSVREHASELQELLSPKRFGSSKHEALQELAKHWVQAAPDYATLPSTRVLESLKAIKGMGDATVLTFLVKALARPDVLVESDGLMRAWLQEHKGVAKEDNVNSKSARLHAAAAWKPWRSVAYLLVCNTKPGARVGVASVFA